MFNSIISKCLFLALLLFSFVPCEIYAIEIGLAPATRKILPETPMPESESITIKAARNEWEGFQIVIRNAADLQNIDVQLSDLVHAEGHVLPASEAILYRQHYLNIEDESPGSLTYHERLPGLYPDPLIPFEDPYREGNISVGAPFDLAAGETASIFIDWHTPENALPGLYEGKATVFANGIDPVELGIEFSVWEFDMPKERGIGTAYGFSWNHIERYHGGNPTDEPFVEEVISRYYNAMHEHRMDPTHINGPVEFEFDESGQLLPVDWTNYDAVVSPWLDGSKFPDGIGIARFNVDRFRPGYGTGSMTEDQFAIAATAFAEHLDEMGWWDQAYVYSIDEPWLNGGDEAWDQIKADAALLFRHSDLWRGHILITGAYQEKLREEVGIWCPVTPMYEDWFYTGDSMAGRAEYAELFEEGVELWFYVCNANFPPYAGYDIDTAIGYEPRIVKWGTWYEGATGFLYWRVNYWVDNDPWNVYFNLEQFGDLFSRTGDGMLFYPGDHNGSHSPKGSPEWLSIDGPIVSYRMKQIRDGFEDWEMFRLAESLGAGEYTRLQVERAYSRFGDFIWEGCDTESLYCPEDQPWTLDENLLAEVRDNIAAKIQYLLYPDRYPDPEYVEPVADGDEEIETSSEDGDEESGIEDDLSEDAQTDGDEHEDSGEQDESVNTPGDETGEGSGSGCSANPVASNGWFLALLAFVFVRRKLWPRMTPPVPLPETPPSR